MEATMAEPKTKASQASVDDFLGAIANEQIRADCQAIVELMQSATKSKPQLWGTSIVGFGRYRLPSASGREADWPLIAFSPRKQNITLYLHLGGLEVDEALSEKLGKYTRGKGCLYIKKLADVHLPTLKKLVRDSVVYMRQAHPSASSS
jgi:hypothetical protein